MSTGRLRRRHPAVRAGAAVRTLVVALAIGGAVAGHGFAAPTITAVGDVDTATLDSTGLADTTPAGAGAASSDPVAEARANFTPESRSYWTTRTLLSFLAPLYAAATMLVLLFSGLSARMRDRAHRLGRNRYLRTLIYLAQFTVASTLLFLPLAWFAGFWLEHRFGLSNQTIGAWLGEQGKGVAVSVVMFGVTGLAALGYHAIERSPRRWWAWLGLGTLPVVLFSTLIQPVFIDPLYNKFEPLQDKALESKILALAAKADIPSRRVFQVDKSRQTKKFNAYVTGFGASQRIVLWDTIIEGMREDELLFVMGHEMGHYRLAHIWKSILLYSVASFALFYLSYRLAGWAMRRFGGRWGFDRLHDLASMPLLALAVGVVMEVAQPIDHTVSRAFEHEADVFALEVTHTNDAGARAFLKLGSQNRSNPEPPALVKALRYSHPPLVERIRFALEYRPWERGEPNRAFEPRR